MRIAVLANLKKNAPIWEGMPTDQWDDLDSPHTIDDILTALHSNDHDAEFFEANILPPFNLVEKLTEYKPDLCFNIAEGHFGDSRESQIPSVLEMLRLPYTGSKVLNLALALDKPMTKRVLYYHGLPTPEFQVFENADDPVDDDLLNTEGELRFPLFVKPSREGTSVGVTVESMVSTVAEMRGQIDKQLKRYNQPILVEHYIKGREITVGMLGNLGSRAARRVNERTAPNTLPEDLLFLPPMEVNLDYYTETEGGVYTNRIKTDLVDTPFYICPADLPDEFIRELNLLAAAVFRVTGCKDIARVDFRLDEANNNKPYILEVNPLPGLNKEYSDLCIEAQTYGWSHEQLINSIVDLAAIRHGLKAGTVRDVITR